MRVKLHIPKESILWLECTLDEAESIVYPLLSEEQIIVSKHCIAIILENWQVGDEEDNSKHPHDIYSKKTIKYPACFKVDFNLVEIEPTPANVPYSQMWNGYCPYELIDEINFSNFEELKLKYRG